MAANDLIPADQICIHHRITHTFLQSLESHGLVRITRVESAAYVDAAELRGLERLVRLHQDLELDAEALDLVTGLLGRIESLQSEVATARRRLQFFEEDRRNAVEEFQG